MLRIKNFKQDERGSTLVEYAIGATVFIMAVFAVLEFGRALWAHNALTDAARRGARYAVLHKSNIGEDANIKNLVVYGNVAGGTQPLLPGLSTANVTVTRSSDFSVNSGTATVSITGYEFKFVLPMLPKKIAMPSYSTTLTGESAGWIP
ncbi:MAG TPA: TadE/TadG family type IV pilus assembly protein [Pyrinomonadaceae bacterium]|nr:TadE/TadG family type IV pilus assembly protein [Pyrinomonadaceae bacterium]